MAGNANSGRKLWTTELEIKEITELANRTIKSLLKRDDLNIDQQLKLALPLVLKRMPDKIEIDDINSISYDEKKELISLLRNALSQPKVIDVIDTSKD